MSGGFRHRLQLDQNILTRELRMRIAPWRDVASGLDAIMVIENLRGRAEGYGWFHLGMAPLAGLEAHPLAPTWNRVAEIVFRHGEHFYNFQGLRDYKDKFDPVWEPKFLASPGGLRLPMILTNLATLISGGAKGLIAK